MRRLNPFANQRDDVAKTGYIVHAKRAVRRYDASPTDMRSGAASHDSANESGENEGMICMSVAFLQIKLYMLF